MDLQALRRFVNATRGLRQKTVRDGRLLQLWIAHARNILFVVVREKRRKPHKRRRFLLCDIIRECRHAAHQKNHTES